MSRWSLWLVDPVCGVRYDSVCFGLNSLWCIQECPLAGTHPYIGKQDEISCEAELKVEVTILAEKLMETVAAVKAVHPYEEPVINVIPLIGIGI